MSTTRASYVCHTCSKKEDEHGQDIRWIKCFLCGEQSVDECAGEQWEVSGIWSCDKCRDVMLTMRTVTKDWDAVKTSLGVTKDGKTDGGSKKDKETIRELEKELRMWKRKMGDKNDMIKKLQNQVHVLEDKAGLLESAEAELRFLRSQRMSSQGGGGFEVSVGDNGGGMGGFPSSGNNSVMMMMNRGAWQGGDQGDFGGNGGNSLDRGRKRSAPYESMISPPIVKQRHVSSVRILFVVDDVFRGLVMNQRLQVEFWRRKWDVRLRRGGDSEAVTEAGLAALKEDPLYNHVVVCAGGMDLELAAQSDESSRMRLRANLVSNIGNLVKAGIQCGSDVWIIAPPPRKQVPNWERNDAACDLQEAFGGFNKAHIYRLEEDLDDNTFIQRRLFDGVHIKQDWEVPSLENILCFMGLDGRVPFEDVFAKEEMFGVDCCWRCGGEHKRTVTQCRDFEKCERCGDRGHHEDVCMSKTKMCMTCGERGHGPVKCSFRQERSTSTSSSRKY